MDGSKLIHFFLKWLYGKVMNDQIRNDGSILTSSYFISNVVEISMTDWDNFFGADGFKLLSRTPKSSICIKLLVLDYWANLQVLLKIHLRCLK